MSIPNLRIATNAKFNWLIMEPATSFKHKEDKEVDRAVTWQEALNKLRERNKNRKTGFAYYRFQRVG